MAGKSSLNLPKPAVARTPEISPDILRVIYEALFTQKKFKATYSPRGKDVTDYEVNPLGIVFVDSVLYLVCTLWGYDNPMQLAVHRISAAVSINQSVQSPTSFSLSEYVTSHQFEHPSGGGPLRLQALFDGDACYHLEETPLSKDQTISETKDGLMLVKATVRDTYQLRWWLLSFGDQVEVIRPKKLRDEMRQISLKMAEQYRNN